MKTRVLFAPALLLAGVMPAFGWGQKGHDTVCAIAESHLTPAALDSVSSLLDGKSIIYWANWLDNASHTPEYAYTKTWHYRNIDAGVEYDQAPQNPNGDVVNAIEAQKIILSDPTASREDKQLALKILVHIVGDIHQPMHVGHASDRGGNNWKIKYFNRDNNLHGIWDTPLVESAHKWSYSEWREQIDRVPEGEIGTVIATPDPNEWGRETFAIATQIYDTTPEGYNVSYDYVSNWTPTIETQLLKGGHRLAYLLNTIFDQQYASPLD